MDARNQATDLLQQAVVVKLRCASRATGRDGEPEQAVVVQRFPITLQRRPHRNVDVRQLFGKGMLFENGLI